VCTPTASDSLGQVRPVAGVTHISPWGINILQRQLADFAKIGVLTSIYSTFPVDISPHHPPRTPPCFHPTGARVVECYVTTPQHQIQFLPFSFYSQIIFNIRVLSVGSFVSGFICRVICVGSYLSGHLCRVISVCYVCL
jgi:hypothetical protein